MEKASLENFIENMPFGRFSIKLILVIGSFWFLNGAESGLTVILVPRLRCVWHMSSLETAITSASALLGSGTGSMFWGWMGDKHGRKPIIIICACMALFYGWLINAADGFLWFMILRFFVGTGLGGMVLTSCYLVEFLGSKHRGKSMLSSGFFYIFGNVFAAVMAYLIINKYNWRIYVILASVPVLAVLFSLWLPESIRYLKETGCYIELRKTLYRIYIENGKPPLEHYKLHYYTPTPQNGQLSMLFTKQNLISILILPIIWISANTNYFGIVLLNIELMQSGVCNVTRSKPTCNTLTDFNYLQNIFVVFGEVPGLLLFLFLEDKIGRKVLIITGFVITSCCLIVINFCPPFIITTIILFLARGVSGASVQAIWIYTSEYYPALIRSTAVGYCNGIATWSLIFTPILVQYIMHYSLTLMTGVFVGLSLISILLIILLKETKGKSIE